MANDKGLIWAKVAAGVLVSAAVGFGGFNLATTGCVLGSCSTDTQATADVLPVSTDAAGMSCSGESGCPFSKQTDTALMAAGDVDCKAKGETTGRPACTCASTDECPFEGAEHAAMTEVAHHTDGEAATDGAHECSGEGACCAGKGADNVAETGAESDENVMVCPITGKKITKSEG